MKQEDIFKIIKIALKTKKRVDLKTSTKKTNTATARRVGNIKSILFRAYLNII